MPLRFKIQVAAPPEKVFDIVSDIANHGSWANPKAGLDVKAVSGGPTQVGSTFKSSQRFAGKQTGADLTVTQYSAPSKLTFDALQAGKKPVTFTNTFTLTPKEGGTLVERSIDAKPANPIAIVVYPAIRADAMKALRNLKARAEGSV
jgi:carbon monoxide dehydrogenase subunit G